MLLLYFWRGTSLFSCNQLFPLFYICFITFFCIKQKFSYFCILFSCGKLDCIWFFFFFVPSICSCLGDKGGDRAAIAVRVSSFQFFFPKEKKLMRKWGYLSLASLIFFFLILFWFYFFEKESPDGCKARNHKYWVPSFGELIVLSSVKS